MKDVETAPPAANFFTLPGAGRTQQVLGVSQIYKAQSDQTGGRLVCVEISVPPGSGVPPHRHTEEDEAFYVLSGQIVIEGDDCGGAPVHLGAGSFFYGPRGRVHGFANHGVDIAKLLVFITPGTGIEAMFAGLAELTRNSATIDPAAVAALCSGYGITFAAPAA
jgi:quercetin dioxygenase-like cupin family protein